MNQSHADLCSGGNYYVGRLDEDIRKLWSWLSLLKAKSLLGLDYAFDEAFADNKILHQLIEGKLPKHKTQLITSRPIFVQNKPSNFDTKFVVDGYDEEEWLKRVKQYAESKKMICPLSEFTLKEENVHEFCDNPLNLTPLRILLEEDTHLTDLSVQVQSK